MFKVSTKLSSYTKFINDKNKTKSKLLQNQTVKKPKVYKNSWQIQIIGSVLNKNCSKAHSFRRHSFSLQNKNSS